VFVIFYNNSFAVNTSTTFSQTFGPSEFHSHSGELLPIPSQHSFCPSITEVRSIIVHCIDPRCSRARRPAHSIAVHTNIRQFQHFHDCRKTKRCPSIYSLNCSNHFMTCFQNVGTIQCIFLLIKFQCSGTGSGAKIVNCSSNMFFQMCLPWSYM